MDPRIFSPDLQQYNLRILTYGYDSQLPESTSNAGILEFSKGLLYSLSTARQSGNVRVNLINKLIYILHLLYKEQTRPIFWVGHSLGGLLIKQASYSSILVKSMLLK